MKIKKLLKKLIVFTICLSFVSAVNINSVSAKVFYLNGGRQFDSDFYAAYYPDLYAKFGTDPQKLLNHYLDYGIFEGRLPSAIYARNMDLLKIGDIVPAALLYNRPDLRKKCDENEFAHAWKIAKPVVASVQTIPRIQQLHILTNRVQTLVNQQVPYSTKAYHYNDPCGVFGCGNPQHQMGASCAGVTRAMGLCLNMLAVPYEHVNANTWNHQWCRVNVNGVYYICDPYLGYVGPEPAPYRHPLVP